MPASSVSYENDARKGALILLEKFLLYNFEKLVLSTIGFHCQLRSRIKTNESFMAKAVKTNDKGEPKYKEPLTEITDQIGFRAICPTFRQCVECSERLGDVFTIAEHQIKGESDPQRFEYSGIHLLCFVPENSDINNLQHLKLPKVFEIQIKTFFSSRSIRFHS